MSDPDIAPIAVNPAGGSGTTQGRDGWCTPKWLADLIGRVQFDPCSNERSHIDAVIRLILADGDNGLDEGGPGSFHIGTSLDGTSSRRAPKSWVTFINPPYARGQVSRWIAHYKHTRFICLLRWDPSTHWFSELVEECHYVWFPAQRINFEPPPGVKSSSNPFPHALYLRFPDDALLTRLRERGYLVPVDSVRRRVQTVRHASEPSGPTSGKDRGPGDPGDGGEEGAAGTAGDRYCDTCWQKLEPSYPEINLYWGV